MSIISVVFLFANLLHAGELPQQEKPRLLKHGDSIMIVTSVPRDSLSSIYIVFGNKIDIKKVGRVKVDGLTITEAQSLIWKKLTDSRLKLYTKDMSVTVDYFKPYKEK